MSYLSRTSPWERHLERLSYAIPQARTGGETFESNADSQLHSLLVAAVMDPEVRSGNTFVRRVAGSSRRACPELKRT
jgi:hypothetical protein